MPDAHMDLNRDMEANLDVYANSDVSKASLKARPPKKKQTAKKSCAGDDYAKENSDGGASITSTSPKLKPVSKTAILPITAFRRQQISRAKRGRWRRCRLRVGCRSILKKDVATWVGVRGVTWGSLQ